MRQKIEQWRDERGVEVCAVIIEPILSEGGDIHISSYYANRLRELTT